MRVAAKLLTIQVVVHVVHRTDAENISDAQVQSQIVALNRDYGLKNADKSKVPAPYKSLVGNPTSSSSWRRRAPDGKATKRDHAHRHDGRRLSAPTTRQAQEVGWQDPWPHRRYLNLWTCTLSGGLLGYAQFPGAPAKTDGVVILHTPSGRKGARPRRSTRAVPRPHEVGHFLNLRPSGATATTARGTTSCRTRPRRRARTSASRSTRT